MNVLPEIITGLISALVGGFVGFRIGIHKQQKLTQKAGKYSQQIQVGKGNVIIGK